MEPKKGNRYLIEVRVANVDHQTGEVKIITEDGSGFWIYIGAFKSAQKIEPTYENGEWYLCKRFEDSEAKPWKHIDGKWRTFCDGGFAYSDLISTNYMHWIGPKIERPEE